MINNVLKNELDQLKNIISVEKSLTWDMSYGDVIIYLIQEFIKPKTIMYPIEPKLLFRNSFSEQSLKISTPMKKTLKKIVVTNVDNKNYISYTF